jgi:hypothetical protein
MSFPIVGIGASAGGLESISTLLAGIPVKTGLAYVFVQHLDPGQGTKISFPASPDNHAFRWDDRHQGVDYPHKVIRFADDYRAGTITIAARLVLSLQFPTVQL